MNEYKNRLMNIKWMNKLMSTLNYVQMNKLLNEQKNESSD